MERLRRHKAPGGGAQDATTSTSLRVAFIRVAAVLLGVSLATLALFFFWNEVEIRTRGNSSSVPIVAAELRRRAEGDVDGKWRHLDLAATNQSHSEEALGFQPSASLAADLSSTSSSSASASASSSPPIVLLSPSPSPDDPNTVSFAEAFGPSISPAAQVAAGSPAAQDSAGGATTSTNVIPVVPALRTPWDAMWRSRTGPVDPKYHSIIRGIVDTVAEKQEWDKGWMLLLQAIMRRRSAEWFTDPRIHGGKYVPDAPTLVDRLHAARETRDCRRTDTTIVAAVMVRGEGRYIQEWLTWHLFVGYSHIVVFYEDSDDGTLDAILPFVGAELVTAIHTPTVPGVPESMAALESQVFRQRLVYDHTLRRLQSVACRYRGEGSPFSPKLAHCSRAELQAYYAAQTTAGPKDAGAFVDPSARPRDASGTPLLGSKWSQKVAWQSKKRRPAPTVVPHFQVEAHKYVNGKRMRPTLQEQAAAAARNAATRVIVKTPVPPVSHTLWLALPDSDEFMMPEPGLCMTAFLSGISTTHAAFGAPWSDMLPNDVLEPRNTLLLRDLTRRLERRRGNSMSKYITNVRYTVAVDIHYPLMMEPFELLDEGRGLIDPERRNAKGVAEHEFGLHEGRKVWNYHFVTRSLEASVWKGVRQVLDDAGRGNARSSRSMLGVALGVDSPDKSPSLPPEEPQAIRDDAAWRQGRAFMLTVLFGPAPQGWRYSPKQEKAAQPGDSAPLAGGQSAGNLKGPLP